MSIWLKILMAVVLGYMALRLWPAANQMIKHGPKGSADDWRGALFPLALVVAFVVLLILLVRQ